MKIITIMILSSILSFFGCKENKKSNKEKTQMDLVLEKSIQDFQNRKIYKKLTPSILETISDDILEQTIFDNIYEIIGEDYVKELENIGKLTIGQQAIWTTWILESEVNNGGFNQFYFNSSGQYAKMAVNGFKIIEAPKHEYLTIRANKIYEENKDRLETYDDGTLESFSESYKDNPLNALDDEFYGLEQIENLRELRTKYIRKNIDQFTTK